MAKKKVPVKKVKPTAKKPAAKTAAAKKPAPAKGKPVKAAPAKKTASTAKPTAVRNASPSKKAVDSDASLGRPLVTVDEKLYMLFHEDYEARQVFEFLRVETVGDLIQISAEEIIRVLTAPVRRTISRIRQRLAEKNRSLQGDEEFTRQHQAKLK